MPKLTSKRGSWELPHVHQWKDRAGDVRAARIPLITPTKRIATIGSCFARELADGMGRLGLQGAMHPTGLYYTSRSIRQEIQRVFGEWPSYHDEPLWKVAGGFTHPFKDYKRAYPTEAEVMGWSDDLDARADELFRRADVVVITLGLIEAWMNPRTGNYFRQIPDPVVFEEVAPRFTRLSVGEMLDDLEEIRRLIRVHTRAEIILTVSPIPLHSTMTALDVRVANVESKSRIRAAVSEFGERNTDVHYFHSYDIVTAAERLSDFMLEDGRHVARKAVDHILRQFMLTFAAEGVKIPEVDTSWITAPTKIAARPEVRASVRNRVKAFIRNVRP